MHIIYFYNLLLKRNRQSQVLDGKSIDLAAHLLVMEKRLSCGTVILWFRTKPLYNWTLSDA